MLPGVHSPIVSARQYPLPLKWQRFWDAGLKPVDQGLTLVGDLTLDRVVTLPALRFGDGDVVDHPFERGLVLRIRSTDYKGDRDTEPRAAQVARTRSGVHVVHVHLGTLRAEDASGRRVPTPEAVFLRWCQLSILVPVVKALPPPVVVLGDFNATPDSHEIPWFLDATGLVAVDPGPPGYTHQRHGIAIDHIFHSPELACTAAGIRSDATFSDHFPVWAAFGLG